MRCLYNRRLTGVHISSFHDDDNALLFSSYRQLHCSLYFTWFNSAVLCLANSHASPSPQSYSELPVWTANSLLKQGDIAIWRFHSCCRPLPFPITMWKASPCFCVVLDELPYWWAAFSCRRRTQQASLLCLKRQLCDPCSYPASHLCGFL